MCSFCISLVTPSDLHFPLDFSPSDSTSLFNFIVEILWAVLLFVSQGISVSLASCPFLELFDFPFIWKILIISLCLGLQVSEPTFAAHWSPLDFAGSWDELWALGNVAVRPKFQSKSLIIVGPCGWIELAGVIMTSSLVCSKPTESGADLGWQRKKKQKAERLFGFAVLVHDKQLRVVLWGALLLPWQGKFPHENSAGIHEW